MATNNFKPFATAANANVMSQSDWEGLPALLSGFTSGKAASAEVNKAIRQASFIAAALAQYTANKSGLDVLDDADLNGFITKMTTAFGKDFQALDATLTALAGLATGANKLPYFTGTDTAAQTDLTEIGRDVIGQTTVANLLTYLGLGTAATKNVGTGSGQIPDMSSFTNASGWQKLPGGKILQWGKAGFPVGQTQISVPFPINFPSVVSNIQLTFADINFSGGTPSPTLAVVNNTVNGAGFGAYMSGAGGFNAYFFAIGS
ncbi:phage tail protein [Enterobacter asburiae]|uniref:gp53-like domain-containing protein n=2 Tax=Enterobacter cloacae complex TaxID=354276 RepID=UPI001F34FC4F|nr:phage tail protein [Enterobacter asburiae]MCF8586544.1 phage tail protein [Enterobacter asburiae]